MGRVWRESTPFQVPSRSLHPSSNAHSPCPSTCTGESQDCSNPRCAPRSSCSNSKLSEKRRKCAYLAEKPTSSVGWFSKRTPVPSVSLVLSARSPLLATAMACSNNRALGRVPAHGSDCSTLCRTVGFRVGSLFSVCRSGWCLRSRCLRGWCLRGWCLR